MNSGHGRRHEPLQLMAEASNITHSKRKQVQEPGKPQARQLQRNRGAIHLGDTVGLPRRQPVALAGSSAVCAVP
jgi:hypothetical protein